MADPVLGKFSNPTSLAQLTRGRGWSSELAGFLLPFARQDFVYKEYDFLETAITDDPNTDWGATDSAGVSAASYTTTPAAVNGVIGADTGTTDNGGVALTFDSVCFAATNKPGLHVRMKTDIVINAANEISFSDAFTDANTIAVTDVDTPAIGNGATDGVFIMYDTDQTHKGLAVVGVGTSTTVLKTIIGSTAAANPLTANTYYDIVLQCYVGAGYAILNHNLSLAQGVLSGPDAAVLMAPKIVTITRSTTAVFPSIDLVRWWVERAT